MKSLLALAALVALVSTASLAADQRQSVAKPFVPASTQPNPALTDDEIRSQVRAYLGTIDTPVGLDAWKALGPRAEPILLEVIGSQALPTRRAKAVDGLTAVGTTHLDLLSALASNESEAFVVRYAAVRGLGYLLPEAQMIAKLSPVLQGAKDERVRAVTALVMAKHAPAASCPLVRAQVAREPASGREPFARSIDACFAQ